MWLALMLHCNDPASAWTTHQRAPAQDEHTLACVPYSAGCACLQDPANFFSDTFYPYAFNPEVRSCALTPIVC